MKYIYGPVKSRRLGMSLGVSLTPYKICNFDCIYCQLGKTKELTQERKEYLQPAEIIDEFKAWFAQNPAEAVNLSYITVSGLGEPTLNTKIGEIIAQIKKITTSPVAVITNASLLNDAVVRSSLFAADLIVPSLDAASPKAFSKIDRAHPDIKIEDIVNGLISLRKEYRGKIWLEVMLVRGANDDLRQIRKLKEAIEKINPDKIQLNSPVRSTTEKEIFPPLKNKLKKIKEMLGDKAEIV